MKSRFLKNLTMGLVVMGAAMALVNCGDTADKVNSAISDAQEQYQPGTEPAVDPLTGEVVDPAAGPADPMAQDPTTESPVNPNTEPVTDPNQGVNDSVTDPDDLCLASSLPDDCGPGTKPLPGSSAAGAEIADPTSSASVETPESCSDGVVPGSSSSEKDESSSSEEVKAEGGIFLADGTDENKDQMEIEYIEHTGWDGAGILAYPKRLSSDKKHAVVMWGPVAEPNPAPTVE